MGDIVPIVYDGDFLGEDLERIRAEPSLAKKVDLLDAFLDEVAGSEQAIWRLPKWSASWHSPFFNCKAIDCFQDAGFNLYRIRPLARSLDTFRVLYAFEHQRNEIHLLALVRRAPRPVAVAAPRWAYYDYEPDHPISQRVRNEYERRGFAKLSTR